MELLDALFGPALTKQDRIDQRKREARQAIASVRVYISRLDMEEGEKWRSLRSRNSPDTDIATDDIAKLLAADVQRIRQRKVDATNMISLLETTLEQCHTVEMSDKLNQLVRQAANTMSSINRDRT
jgi:hypothetical protein